MSKVSKTRENLKNVARQPQQQHGGRPMDDLLYTNDQATTTTTKDTTKPTTTATPATTATPDNPDDSFYTYRSDAQDRMDGHIQVEIATMLLSSLKNKLRKGIDVDKPVTIAELCKMKYKDACTYTHIVSAIPFIVDDKGNQCRINYQTGKADMIGPYVICTTKPFETFIENGDFNLFVQRRFDDIANATDDCKDKKGRRAVLGAKRVSLFAKYNHQPYDFVDDKKPPTIEEKLKENIEKYSKIVKAKRDREQQEWLEMHRAMQTKRKQVLREEQKYALNHVYEKLLGDGEMQYNMVLPRTVMPSYGDEHAFRPRFRPTRHYERQRQRRATIKNYNIATNEDYDDYRVSADAYETNPVEAVMDDEATRGQPPATKKRRVPSSGRGSRGRRSSFT